MKALGIDIGGSGMKGAVVDIPSGKLVSERYRLETPRVSTPQAMAGVVQKIVDHFAWKGPIGVALPGPIKGGKTMTANNVHKSWIGADARKVFEGKTGRKVSVLNDADAAGLAEMKFGAGKNRKGVVVLLTFGTGIGSAVFVDGKLVPNTEFGQLPIRGKRGELRASARVRKEKGLNWKQWAKLVDEYINAVEQLIWPDLIIVGGGVSARAEKFLPYIKTHARIVPARLRNGAGIVGAALSTAVTTKK